MSHPFAGSINPSVIGPRRIPPLSWTKKKNTAVPIDPSSISSLKVIWVVSKDVDKMAIDHAEHKISGNNILFGLTHFLILTLPSDWRITRSYLQPDIHSNVRRGELLWVEAGQTDQVVYHPSRKIALDLTIVVKRGRRDRFKTKGITVHSEGSLNINGHEAFYILGEVGIGFLKKKLAKTLRLYFHCSELERTIMISFTGNCQEADMIEIFESLAGSRCH